MEHFSYKGGCGYVNIVHVLRPLKELAWATNKQLQVISNKNIFKIVILLRKLKNKAVFNRVGGISPAAPVLAGPVFSQGKKQNSIFAKGK